MSDNATIGERILRARQSWDRSQRELTNETGISQSTLSRIESGRRVPELNEVLSLSWALGYTVTELTGHSPERGRARFAARAGLPPEQEGRQAAEAFRAEHGLALAPIADLVTLIERTQDVDVAILAGSPEVQGFSGYDPERGQVILAAATSPSPTRQRCALAHELAHILFDDYLLCDHATARDRAEVRADAFARHLLVPLGALTPLPPGELSAAASDLVQTFKASPEVVAAQLQATGQVEASAAERLARLSTRMLATRFGWSDLYASWRDESSKRRAPQKLLTRAIDAYHNGLIPSTFVARLRHVTVDEIESDLGVQGRLPLGPDPAEYSTFDEAQFPYGDVDWDHPQR